LGERVNVGSGGAIGGFRRDCAKINAASDGNYAGDAFNHWIINRVTC
jgi:hypothetical protein